MKFPTLKTERLFIRPMEIGDIEFFTELRNKCVKFLHTSKRYKLSQAKLWFKKNKPIYFIIVMFGKNVGYIRTSDWDMVNKNLYIGADILPTFRNKGVAYEALKVFIEYLFKRKFNKVSLEVLDFNTKAIGLYKKLGFKKEGVRAHHVKKGRKYVDSIIMGLINSNKIKKGKAKKD